MLEQLTTILNQYNNAFHQEIPLYRQNRYIQIVVLRETKSHAIFTTEGQTLDVERLQAGLVNRKQIDRVVMYKRKQIAPERRTGKALMRDLGILEELDGQIKKRRSRSNHPIVRSWVEAVAIVPTAFFMVMLLLQGLAANALAS
ncbi:MAG: type I-D CRISPR-associated protein Cas7/Csc2 [Ktedonobacteraceae bacterium]